MARTEQTMKRLRQRALMVSRFAYDAHFQKLHASEEAEFASFESAIAPHNSAGKSYVYILNRAKELTPRALEALKTLVREGIVLQAPDSYLEACE